jgi:hypothetical protein
MRTPCRTSSSTPAAAVAISCPAEKSSSSTATVFGPQDFPDAVE